MVFNWCCTSGFPSEFWQSLCNNVHSNTYSGNDEFLVLKELNPIHKKGLLRFFKKVNTYDTSDRIDSTCYSKQPVQQRVSAGLLSQVFAVLHSYSFGIFLCSVSTYSHTLDNYQSRCSRGRSNYKISYELFTKFSQEVTINTPLTLLISNKVDVFDTSSCDTFSFDWLIFSKRKTDK